MTHRARPIGVVDSTGLRKKTKRARTPGRRRARSREHGDGWRRVEHGGDDGVKGLRPAGIG
jgi:hypothetical protein